VLSGPLWLIGCGNMGGAMVRGWIGAGADPALITVIDPALPALPDGIRVLPAIPHSEPAPAMLMLAVKPQLLNEVAPTVAAAVGADTLLVSILAGVEIATLRTHFPTPRRVLRVMPNLPAAVGAGISALFGDGLSEVDSVDAGRLLEPLGLVEWLKDEEEFHAIVALSGSGPAFVFRFVEALAEGGVRLGLPRDQALRLALATVEGSAAFAAADGASPRELAVRVTSPNGTTQAGLERLDLDGVFAKTIEETMATTAKRSAQMAEEARPKG
jgi:pyrroline-5-carboxylate reductase